MKSALETRRLMFRAPRHGDARLLFPLFSDPASMQYFGPERPLSLAETARWIQNHEALRNAEGFAPWVICLRESGTPVGWGGLSRDSRDDRPFNELIYILARERWGRGLGTELARASLTYGFGTLGLPDIETTVRPQNTASVRILLRLGLVLTGRDDSGKDRYRTTSSEASARRRGPAPRRTPNGP